MGEIYLEIYFPIIGLFCTWYYAVTMFMYLIVCIKYYLALNMLYYRTYVETKLKGEVLEEFVRWREIKVGWEEESGEEREREIENGMIVRNEI